MHAVLPLFLGLLGLASSSGSKRGAAAAPKAATATRPTPRSSAAAPARATNTPVATEDERARAAVNAAVAQAIKEEFMTPKPAAPKPAAGTGKTMPAAAAKPKKAKKAPPAAAPAAAQASSSRLASLPSPLAPITVDAREENFAPPSSIPSRSPKQAALDLKAFLVRTKRFGSKNDRVTEVQDAQEDLGVKPDGIVGPETRAATKKYGVTLPVRA